MGRNKQVTPRKRSMISQYVKDGLNSTEISAKLGIARRTVCDIVNRFKQTGSVDVRRRSGRPRITTRRDDLLIRRAAVKNPTLSSCLIKLETGLHASTRTVRRRLVDEFGLRARRPAKKPLINAKQRQKRLQFCNKYKHYTVADWNKVLFSDESTFCQFGSSVRSVRRPVGERYNQRYTLATVKHCPKVMVWGSFSGMGRGSLYFVPKGKTVNSELYLDILQSKVQLTMQIHGCSTFQQDSAPAHTSRVVKLWLQRNRIEVLEWPGNSPDLNPIENLWMLLKRKVNSHHATSMQELMYFIKRAWCRDITPELCQRLVASMPKRVKDVIRNKGYVTKY